MFFSNWDMTVHAAQQVTSVSINDVLLLACYFLMALGMCLSDGHTGLFRAGVVRNHQKGR